MVPVNADEVEGLVAAGPGSAEEVVVECPDRWNGDMAARLGSSDEVVAAGPGSRDEVVAARPGSRDKVVAVGPGRWQSAAQAERMRVLRSQLRDFYMAEARALVGLGGGSRWAQEEGPSKAFYAALKQRWSRTCLDTLRGPAGLVTDPGEVREVARSFYADLFAQWDTGCRFSRLDLLGADLVAVFTECSSVGRLPASMSTGLVTVLYKGRGDREDLTCWRPITLLTADYKILAKTCGVPGRSCALNLALVRDVVCWSEQRGLSAALLSLDQEKAFDRVDHRFLSQVLRRMGFGPGFWGWVRLLYGGAVSRLRIGGSLSAPVAQRGGVRQGCPLSPLLYVLYILLYVLYIEPLVARLRGDPAIRGVHLPGAGGLSAKVTAFADDLTLFLTTECSFRAVVAILAAFGQAPGRSVPGPFSVQQSVRILGLDFTHLESAQHNWNALLDKVTQTLSGGAVPRGGLLWLIEKAVLGWPVGPVAPPDVPVDLLTALGEDMELEPGRVALPKRPAASSDEELARLRREPKRERREGPQAAPEGPPSGPAAVQEAPASMLEPVPAEEDGAGRAEEDHVDPPSGWSGDLPVVPDTPDEVLCGRDAALAGETAGQGSGGEVGHGTAVSLRLARLPMEVQYLLSGRSLLLSGLPAFLCGLGGGSRWAPEEGPSKAFYASLWQRQSRTFLDTLRGPTGLVTDPGEVMGMARSFYVDLFAERDTDPGAAAEYLGWLGHALPELDRLSLEGYVTLSEAEAAMGTLS
ncbi:hypothetical protein ACEWY4_024489 [Coilia grayii]|uniref:Reverse transcriptase domain-containing protein n=1 Tax=Coilia grayii TaxID=363190 RepID=A0ABD1J0H4_9TELE